MNFFLSGPHARLLSNDEKGSFARGLLYFLFLSFPSQFGQDWDVYLSKSDGSYRKMTVDELLPASFGPKDLHEEKRLTFLMSTEH